LPWPASPQWTRDWPDARANVRSLSPIPSTRISCWQKRIAGWAFSLTNTLTHACSLAPLQYTSTRIFVDEREFLVELFSPF
jgi:hypothetical protein